MTLQLRIAILQILKQHEETGSADYYEDAELAEELEEPKDEVQRQLRILKSQRFIELVEIYGPKYEAMISPEGMLFLESLPEPPPKKPPMGFTRD